MSLAANLADLYRIGYEDLPHLSRHFGAAADDCLDAASGGASPFQHDGDIGAGGSNGAWSAYVTLRNQLATVLRTESENLDAMGRAVVDCARAYAAADDTAAGDFRRLTRGLDGRPDALAEG